MLRKILQILTRPATYIITLLYFVVLFGFKVALGFNILNIFTLLFVPLTALAIYFLWNIFYSVTILEEISDNRLKSKYFPIISAKYERKVQELMKLRDEIKKFTQSKDLNPLKESLINEITNLNFNDLIQKYAQNCVKIEFIDNFLNKKAKKLNSIGDKIEKLKSARGKYAKLNEDIFNAFESIQAQTVIILADDISSDFASKESLDEINKKIKTIDSTNNEVNSFYTSINE